MFKYFVHLPGHLNSKQGEFLNARRHSRSPFIMNLVNPYTTCTQSYLDFDRRRKQSIPVFTQCPGITPEMLEGFSIYRSVPGSVFYGTFAPRALCSKNGTMFLLVYFVT